MRGPRMAAWRAERARRAAPVDVMSVSAAAPTEAMSVSIVRKVIFLSLVFQFAKDRVGTPYGLSFRLLSGG